MKLDKVVQKTIFTNPKIVTECFYSHASFHAGGKPHYGGDSIKKVVSTHKLCRTEKTKR